MNDKRVIAVIGLPGAGKTEAINYIIKKCGYPKVYFGDVTFYELKKRGMEVSEKNERMIREELREKHGMGAYAIYALPKIEKLLEKSKVVLVESMYSWEEYLELRKKIKENFEVIAVHASPKTRYSRLKNRPERPLTKEEAESRDHSQIENLHQAGPIAMADYILDNSNDINSLHSQIDRIISECKN